MLDYKIPTNLHSNAESFIQEVISVLNEQDKLESIDDAAMTLLAINYSIFCKAYDSIKDNFIIINAQGNLVSNPLVKIMNDAQTQVQKIMNEFGLTVKSRKKLNEREQATEQSDFDKLLSSI